MDGKRKNNITLNTNYKIYTMQSLKKSLPVFLLLMIMVTVVMAQIQDVGISEQVNTDQPSWIENPIGSIIGLILLIGMFAGMAKVALAKE